MKSTLKSFAMRIAFWLILLVMRSFLLISKILDYILAAVIGAGLYLLFSGLTILVLVASLVPLPYTAILAAVFIWILPGFRKQRK